MFDIVPLQPNSPTSQSDKNSLVWWIRNEDGVNMRITITFAISAQWTVQRILERSWKISTIIKILVMIMMMMRMLVVVMSTKLTKQSRVYRGTWCVFRTERGNWSRRSAALLLRRLRGTLTPRSLQQKINSWNVWFEKHCTAWNEAQKLDHFCKQTNKYQISFHSQTTQVMDNAHGPKSAYIQPSMDNEWIDIITYFRVQRNLRMAASDFVAPLLTGEKKDGGPPGLLGTKSVPQQSIQHCFHPT